ncbi:TAFII28 domain-containing protein [Mycena kentingensis (nom. inval.)]|nr:TAFII28 domain-containing protein [Mycena kentingensis (nom. inval.)]
MTTPYGQPYPPPARGRGRGGTASNASSRPGTPGTPTTSYRQFSNTTFPTAASTFNAAYPTASSAYPATPTMYQPATAPSAYGQYATNYRPGSATYGGSYATAQYGVQGYGASTGVSTMIGLSGAPTVLAGAPAAGYAARPAGEEDGEGDDELLPAMADDDYSAQLSWQSESKDNLKHAPHLHFTPEQYERFEAYRRAALSKQAVRKVIQNMGLQVSVPIAQIVAGFSKVFIGEMVEKARAVQARRGESGPLSPDHLREAYRMYQQETGAVGAARPLRSKKLFVR